MLIIHADIGRSTERKPRQEVDIWTRMSIRHTMAGVILNNLFYSYLNNSRYFRVLLTYLIRQIVD